MERESVIAKHFDLPEIKLNCNLWEFEGHFKLSASNILVKEKQQHENATRMFVEKQGAQMKSRVSHLPDHMEHQGVWDGSGGNLVARPYRSRRGEMGRLMPPPSHVLAQSLHLKMQYLSQLERKAMPVTKLEH